MIMFAALYTFNIDKYLNNSNLKIAICGRRETVYSYPSDRYSIERNTPNPSINCHCLL